MVEEEYKKILSEDLNLSWYNSEEMENSLGEWLMYKNSDKYYTVYKFKRYVSGEKILEELTNTNNHFIRKSDDYFLPIEFKK
jgi:hypothetical protein